MAVDFELIHKALPRSSSGLLPDADALSEVMAVLAFMGGKREWPPVRRGEIPLPIIVKDINSDNYVIPLVHRSFYSRLNSSEVVVRIKITLPAVGGENVPSLILPFPSNRNQDGDVMVGYAWVSGSIARVFRKNNGQLYFQNDNNQAINGSNQELMMQLVVSSSVGEDS